MSDKNNKTLKPAWRRVKFGDVVRLSKARSQDPLADGIERYVGLEHLEPGDLRIRRWGSVADGVTFTSVFQPGQVLFGKRRAYQRKVAVADFSGVCSGDIYVLETKDAQVLLPELLPFICQTDAFFDHAVGTSAGSLSPRTNWTSLADFEFVLPPLEEQLQVNQVLGAISDVIDEQSNLARSVDSTVESALFELIPSAADELLSGWRTCELQDIARIVRGSSPRPKGDKRFYGGSVPRLMVEDITRDGRIVTPKIDFLTEAGAALSRPVPAGTVIVVCSGSVGVPAILAIDACIHDGLLGLPDLDNDVDPNFLYFALRRAKRDFLRMTTNGGIWSNLTTDILKRFRIALPQLNRQKEIAAQLIALEAVKQTAVSRISQTSALRGEIWRNTLEAV